jgi:hypothetical protein
MRNEPVELRQAFCTTLLRCRNMRRMLLRTICGSAVLSPSWVQMRMAPVDMFVGGAYRALVAGSDCVWDVSVPLLSIGVIGVN